MAARAAAGALIGVVFGVMLCWTGMANPGVVRAALLFEQSYLYLFMASAVATGAAGLWWLRRRAGRAPLTGERIGWRTERPGRRHVLGSVIFGVGWGLSNVCPGPIAADLGLGAWWALPVAAGVVIGVTAYQRAGARETEPASDATPPAESSTLLPRVAAAPSR
jgi:uncharacterized membrane protein YedE/YeeE